MTVAEQVKGEIELPSDVEIMFVTKTGTATMTGDGIGFTAVADAGVGDTSVGTNVNQGDDKFEEFDPTDSDVGDFDDFEEDFALVNNFVAFLVVCPFSRSSLRHVIEQAALHRHHRPATTIGIVHGSQR